MENETERILRMLEGYLKIRNITKIELAQKWGKTTNYVYRRFSGDVELSLLDILNISNILKLTKEEAANIFFENKLRDT